MIELNSIRRPQGAAEAAAAAPMRSLRAGGVGGASEVSRAERALLVKGKRAEPLVRAVGPRRAAETVIGIDERTRILETETNPWRMICALRMHSPFGSAIGTGWFAGPKTLVTAGHCVYDESFFGGWATEIEVSPGRSGDEFPFRTLKSQSFSTVDRWVRDADPDFDIGCIQLDKPIGEEVGWFAVGALTGPELETYLVNVSGYPGDRGEGTQQYHHANRIRQVTARRIFYDVDTFGGQSGAPAWIYESEEAEPLVVGIHAYGTGATPPSFGITANSAPRIIPEVLEQIGEWVDEA